KDTGAGAGADPVRPDARLAVHVLRGAAYLMASDLADGPRTGLHAQLYGDAHLSNFGTFAHPTGGWCSASMTSTRRCRPVRVGSEPASCELRGRWARPQLR